MEMKSLGKKSGMGILEKESTKEVYYPEVTITQEALPGLKGNDVGNTIKLAVEAEVCSISQYGNGDIDYRLKLKKAGIKEDTE